MDPRVLIDRASAPYPAPRPKRHRKSTNPPGGHPAGANRSPDRPGVRPGRGRLPAGVAHRRLLPGDCGMEKRCQEPGGCRGPLKGIGGRLFCSGWKLQRPSKAARSGCSDLATIGPGLARRERRPVALIE